MSETLKLYTLSRLMHEWQMFLLAHLKVLAAAVSCAVIATVDAIVSEAQKVAAWESLGLKGLLIAAILWLAKELAKERALSESKLKAERDDAKAERAAFTTAISAIATGQAKVADALEDQTEWFKSIGQKMIDHGMETLDTPPR